MATDLNDILDDLDALADDESDVSLGDVVEKIGPRGRGVILLIPGLIWGQLTITFLSMPRTRLWRRFSSSP